MMSKFCSAVGHRVTYLTCLECEERVCEGKPTVTILPRKNENKQENPKKNTIEAVDSSKQETTVDNKCPSCETCFHKTGECDMQLFGAVRHVTYCEVFKNRLIFSGNVAKEGCEYHNIDLSSEKICMNCQHFLGGGDWGLACAAKYHALPSALDKACEQFKHKNSKIE